MSDETSDGSPSGPVRLAPAGIKRDRRRHLHPIIRYFLIAAVGGSMGLMASYAMRKIGM